MVAQYVAIALQNTIWGIQKRSDIKRNIEHIGNLIGAASRVCELEAPVKLVAICEGGLTGFTDEIFEYDHVRAAKELYIEIPGEETEALGEICKTFGIYLIAQCKARDSELWPDGDRFFNLAFIIDPTGRVIHKHHKTCVFQREHSTCPHDIWDRFIEVHGTDPQKLVEALFPVTRTEIGNIGTLVCMEGSYPEAARALALNGAEIIYRPTYPEPWVGPTNDVWVIQNRAHAIFNTCYVIAPNKGNYYAAPWAVKDWHYTMPTISGARSMIIDYHGRILHEVVSSGDGYSAAILDIEALREFRVVSKFQNFLKDLRVEQYKLIYEAAEKRGGIFPKNLWMKEPPKGHAETDKIFAKVKRSLIDKGIWTKPGKFSDEELKKMLGLGPEE
jgi:predicted amidohydrolase